MSAIRTEGDKEIALTRDLFASVVWIILRFHAASFAGAEFPNVHAIDAVLALAVPVFLLWCQASRSDVLDLLLWIDISVSLDY